LRKINSSDKLFFFEKHFFTLDGLWMIETEEKIGWNDALQIDLDVWIDLLRIIMRRLKRYLNINDNSLASLIKILDFRWQVEGWKFEIAFQDENICKIKVSDCPYNSAMQRNPNRIERGPLICKNMCIPFYKSVVKEYNPDIKLNRFHYLGLGDDYCSFELEMDGSNGGFGNLRQHKVKVSDKDKLFYFENNFKTLDGLWFNKIEENSSFELALKIDTNVWHKLYEIAFKRVHRYLHLQSNDLANLIKVISFIFSCEGLDFSITENNADEVSMRISGCPYIEVMTRIPLRRPYMERICKEMCISYINKAVKSYNSAIKLTRTRFLGAGDKFCDISFQLK
jgi:hypothetical protein